MDVSAKGIPGRVRDLLAVHLGIEEDERATKLRDEMALIDDLGCDSLDCVEMVMAAEEEFDVEIPDEDVEPIVTVLDLVRYIERTQQR